MTLRVIIVFLIFSAYSCNFLTDFKTEESAVKTVNEYYSNGNIKYEFRLVDGKKNGISKSYYPDGKLRMEASYKDDVKHGISRTYYKNGNIYMESPYDSGRVTGIRRKYSESGKLIAEVPMKKNETLAGLKEYDKNGKLLTSYSKIKITPVNNLLKDNQYHLDITLSNGSKNAKFLLGELTETGEIAEDAMCIKDLRKGKARLTYVILPGMFQMQKLNIIAVYTTKYRNKYITQTTYHLAVENKPI